MSQFKQSNNPQNLISNIVGKKIYLENISAQMIDSLKEMGAFQMAYRDKLIWLIQCADRDVLIKTLQELNHLGFLFVGGNSGYSAVDTFTLLLNEKNLNVKFKEVWWRSPSDWFIIER